MLLVGLSFFLVPNGTLSYIGLLLIGVGVGFSGTGTCFSIVCSLVTSNESSEFWITNLSFSFSRSLIFSLRLLIVLLFFVIMSFRDLTSDIKFEVISKASLYVTTAAAAKINLTLSEDFVNGAYQKFDEIVVK